MSERLYIMATKKISGIYIITNITNGKIYVDESLDIYRRWNKEHIPELRKGKHYNYQLQKDFDKYGEENFRFEILERYEVDNPVMTKARLIILESYYMKSYRESHIDLYNEEDTLKEILKGNKILDNVFIHAIVGTLAKHKIRNYDGCVFFGRRNTLKDCLFDYVKLKNGETKEKVYKDFLEYLNLEGIKVHSYTRRFAFNYILNGKTSHIEVDEIRDERLNDVIKSVILFSESRSIKKIQKK